MTTQLLTLSCLLISALLPQSSPANWYDLSSKDGLNRNHTLLLSDTPNETDVPRRFRSMAAAPSTTPLMRQLKQIRMSGSAQLSKAHIDTLSQQLNTTPTLIDLRQESKAFINNTPMTWYGFANADNQHLNPSQIIAKENGLMQSLAQQPYAVIHRLSNGPDAKSQGLIHHTEFQIQSVDTIVSEQYLSNQANLGYQRYFVTDHHSPSDETVDAFLDFYKTHSDQWLHFHCRGGRGRTSTFMMMTAMLALPELPSLMSLNEAMVSLGNKDLLALPEDEYTQWKANTAKERRDFILRFYDYVSDNSGYRSGISWREWKARQVSA